MCITGHIYKIIHLDSNIQYIGSTCDSISGRWRTHKSAYNKWLNNKEKYNSIAIYPYFEKYSIDRFKMILIKSYQVYDKKHLRVYEQFAINITKCVNSIAAFQLVSDNCMSKHYNILRSEQRKEYREQYRQANKDKISKQMKHYYQENKEQQKEYREQYRQANKNKISAKIQCECGSIVSKSTLSAHRKTQKHLRLLAAQSN